MTAPAPRHVHLDALLLALASSTDNFTVGFSVGIVGQHLPLWANFFIAFCNACGAFVASWGGVGLGRTLPTLAPLLAGAAFAVLSLLEYREYRRRDENRKEENVSFANKALGLAFPMTLNNLAGGVAGGAAGLSPTINALYALLGSMVTMGVGHVLGKRVRSKSWQPLNPTLLTSLLLGVLGVLTLYDTLTSST